MVLPVLAETSSSSSSHWTCETITIENIIAKRSNIIKSDQLEQGITEKVPWSGFWWPHQGYEGFPSLSDPGGVLEKFDSYALQSLYSPSKARERELELTSNSDYWEGYCTAWAAASILAEEPIARDRADSQDSHPAPLSFDTHELKGILTLLYAEPDMEILAGRRCHSDENITSSECLDVAPCWLEYLLREYILKQRRAIIVDIHPFKPVFNFPLFAYSRSSFFEFDGDGATEHVALVLWFVMAGRGGQATTPSYDHSFDITYSKDGKVKSCEWTYESINSHPDVVWIAHGRVPGGAENRNEHLKEEILMEILDTYSTTKRREHI